MGNCLSPLAASSERGEHREGVTSTSVRGKGRAVATGVSRLEGDEAGTASDVNVDEGMEYLISTGDKDCGGLALADAVQKPSFTPRKSPMQSVKPTKTFLDAGQLQQPGAGEKKTKFVIGHNNEAGEDVLEEATNNHRVSRKKTPKDREMILGALKENLVCSSLNSKETDALCDVMQFFQYKAGESVCTQGEMGTHFFIVNDGSFDIVVNNKAVNQMGRGKTFGDIALIHNSPRNAGVVAVVAGTLWGVNRRAFRLILKQLSSRNFAENRQFLDSVKIFSMLTEAQKSMICNAFILEVFEKGGALFSEGAPGDCLYILKEGTVTVTIGEKEVRVLNKGDYFGERALLYDEPRSATITATSHVVCVSLGRKILGQVLGNLQDLLFRNVMLIALQSTSMFQAFTYEELLKMVDTAGTILSLDDAAIIMEPTPDVDVSRTATRFLIVLEGDVSVTEMTDKIGKNTQDLNRGMCFGEAYVLKSSSPIRHTVRSKGASKVVVFTAGGFEMCLGSRDLDLTLDYNNKRAIVRKNYIFRYLSDKQMDTFICSFLSIDKKANETIFKQGASGKEFFIIKSGEVNITKDNKHIRTCGKNDYFGERSLLMDEKRSATVSARTDVTLWSVKKEVFLKIVEGPMLEHLESRMQMQDTKINKEDLETIRTVGRGTFGTVKLVRHKPTQTRFALKCVKRQTVISLNQQEHIRLEREIMAENDHPFIIKLVRTFKDNLHVYFLTELITGGELYDAIRKLGLLNRYQAQFYLASMIVAIEYLHERSIAYRDLKPENVLLDNQGYIKLIDFGCAKKMTDRSYTLVGTPHYMAPEVILGKGYTVAADIWAFGICLFEFMCGPLPFGNDAEDQFEIFRDILTGKIVIPPYVTDQDAVNLMKRLMCRLPEVRIGCSVNGFKDIKDHAFFADYDWDKLLGRSLVPPLLPKGESYAEDEEENKRAGSDADSNGENQKVEDIKGSAAPTDWDKDF